MDVNFCGIRNLEKTYFLLLVLEELKDCVFTKKEYDAIFEKYQNDKTTLEWARYKGFITIERQEFFTIKDTMGEEITAHRNYYKVTDKISLIFAISKAIELNFYTKNDFNEMRLNLIENELQRASEKLNRVMEMVQFVKQL